VSSGPDTSAAAETAALVALLKTGRREPWAYARLMEETGSARAILEEEDGLLAGERQDAAAAELADWSNQGIGVLTVLDPRYPPNLAAVHDRPLLIFVAGRLRDTDSRSVAVIGSRRATPAGIEQARIISERLAGAGYTIVSGLAAGIDTAAHRTALDLGARTIAVVGTGLRRVYPPENAALQRQIAAEGAVVSQFWPDDGPSRQSFPLRNGVMSGLALATVIVEASQTSGARIQARLALGHGRPVLLSSSLLAQPWAGELSARPAVHVFRSARDLTERVEQLTSTDTLVP
jgi:DNA processing protein